MPKKENSSCPEKAKPQRMKKEYKVAFFAVLFLSFFGRSDVMARKTGIVPSGLIRVKNEVKHKKRKEKAVSIVFFITN